MEMRFKKGVWWWRQAFGMLPPHHHTHFLNQISIIKFVTGERARGGALLALSPVTNLMLT